MKNLQISIVYSSSQHGVWFLHFGYFFVNDIVLFKSPCFANLHPGLGLAAELGAQNLEKDSSHMLQCRNYLEMRLVETFGTKVAVNCPNSPRLPNTSNFAVLLDECRYELHTKS